MITFNDSKSRADPPVNKTHKQLNWPQQELRISPTSHQPLGFCLQLKNRDDYITIKEGKTLSLLSHSYPKPLSLACEGKALKTINITNRIEKEKVWAGCTAQTPNMDKVHVAETEAPWFQTVDLAIRVSQLSYLAWDWFGLDSRLTSDGIQRCEGRLQGS